MQPAKAEVQPARSGQLSEYAYERICEAIVYGRLDLGEPLSENELAEALQISKAPVRVALRELRARGLVEIVAQSGSYVFSPTREQIEELCEFRFLLEERALRQAMETDAKALIDDLQRIVASMREHFAESDWFESKLRDSEFHAAFIRHSGNRYLQASYDAVVQLIEALRYRFTDTVGYRIKAHDEHLRMLELLQQGRVSKATDILRDHISRTREFQSSVSWSEGRSRRSFYRSRDYRQLLADDTKTKKK